jgi:exodeoxyribonuclease VII large subunit
MEKYINVLNPQNVLNKGYSITYLNGKVLKNKNDIKKGDCLITKLSEGEVRSIVE